jgi:3-oxoacyl-[acyl-carrier protein] reductase
VVILPVSARLDDRVALVTGASAPDGLGFATARLLGALGARVAVAGTTDRVHERADELDADGVPAHGVVADLTQEDQVAAAVAAVGDSLGAPTILVNNAGMTSVHAPGLEAESGEASTLSYEQWRRSLARNLDTAFLVTRAVLPGMLRRGWGRVVMVT